MITYQQAQYDAAAAAIQILADGQKHMRRELFDDKTAPGAGIRWQISFLRRLCRARLCTMYDDVRQHTSYQLTDEGRVRIAEALEGPIAMAALITDPAEPVLVPQPVPQPVPETEPQTEPGMPDWIQTDSAKGMWILLQNMVYLRERVDQVATDVSRLVKELS